MENTPIEWTDHTWNGWRICTPVSPGCANCYAAALAKRTGVGEYRKGIPRIRTSADNWKKPLKWNNQIWRQCRACGHRWNGDGYCTACSKNECDIVRPRVFSFSLADWLDDEAPIEWLADFLQLIHDTPHLDWLLLTKRPENWKSRLMDVLRMFERTAAKLPASYHFALNWAAGDTHDNVWIGTTVEDQTRADSRIPQLLQIPAKVRFLSCEPLLGPVNLYQATHTVVSTSKHGLDWVIAGGESGPKARPMHPDWARSLRDQCAAAQVPFLFKQFGEWLPVSQWDGDDFKGSSLAIRHDGAVFEADEPHGFCCANCKVEDVLRVGKKKSGRTLDGVIHNAFPSVVTTRGPEPVEGQPLSPLTHP